MKARSWGEDERTPPNDLKPERQRVECLMGSSLILLLQNSAGYPPRTLPRRFKWSAASSCVLVICPPWSKLAGQAEVMNDPGVI